MHIGVSDIGRKLKISVFLLPILPILYCTVQNKFKKYILDLQYIFDFNSIHCNTIQWPECININSTYSHIQKNVINVYGGSIYVSEARTSVHSAL
jgi:hypothetical protein